MRIACWSRAGKRYCPVIQVEFPVGQVTFHFHLGKGAGKLSANLNAFKDLPEGRKIWERLWSKLEFKFFSKLCEGHNVTFHHCFILQPETILSHMKFLLSRLTSLNEESLVHIARVLDPSRPSFRSLASKVRPPRQR